MADANPLSSIRTGPYDNPPANVPHIPRSMSTYVSATPPVRRRIRGGRARLRAAGEEIAQPPVGPANDISAPRNDITAIRNDIQAARNQSSISRRRRRSPDTDDTEDTAGQGDEYLPSDYRRVQRHLKRRRLEYGAVHRTPIKYGRYGQVEPGRLKLELISCDGGEHVDPHSPSTFLGPQNVLRHDKSVYCSERPHANMVMTHADDTTFCLEKIYIVGPEHGFTAPVREGLVYVGMTLEHLNPYIDPPLHAQRRGIHTPPYRRPLRWTRRASPERLSFADALNDAEIGAATRNDGEIGAAFDNNRIAEGRLGNSDYWRYWMRGRVRDRDSDRERNCEISSPENAPDVVTSADSNGRRVTITADAEPGPEETSSQDVVDFRAQRQRALSRRNAYYTMPDRWEMVRTIEQNGRARWFAEVNEASAPLNDTSNYPNRTLARLDAMMARSRVDDEDDGGDSTDAAPTTDIENENDRTPVAKGVEEDLRDPNITVARFRITRGKYKVAITFDPPVSGRYILFKLWAHKSNVDVQSIVANGYGGCRFFPAIEMR